MEIDSVFLDKYKILRSLGQGGMGKVYLAQNIKLESFWAIKQISKVRQNENIVMEQDILKKLNHPSLPRIFDIEEDNDFYYIIADFIEGKSLDKELKEKGFFSEKTVIRWALCICEVFIYLHNMKPNPIIYRDMKPSNIMVTPTGDIKLIDFGIAREYKVNSDSDTVYIGTRGYAAPEQYGFGQTSVTSDIYSLGVTLHHLITGKNPAIPPLELMPARSFREDISLEFEKILLKCTDYDKSKRYQTAEELKRELELLDSELSAKIKAPLDENSNKIYSYKRKIITILGNPEVGVELAFAIKKLTGSKVLLLESSRDLLKAEMYFNIKPSNKYITTFDELESEFQQDDNKIKEYCSAKTNDFSYFGINATADSLIDRDNDELVFKKLIDEAYRNFDVTIILGKYSLEDSLCLTAINESDEVIFTVNANMDELIMLDFKIKKLIQTNKKLADNIKIIAWEYKNQINLHETILKKVLGTDGYIGQIPYSEDRERARNIEGGSFIKSKIKEFESQYEKILSKIGIKHRKESIFNWLKQK